MGTGSDSQEDELPDLGSLIARAAGEGRLDGADAEAAFNVVMEGRATPVQIAALLVAMKARRETAEEVAGGVRALRRAMIPVPASDPDQLVDTCGTGGGALTTFNISTAAAFVAAGAGVRIAKHGNRSFSSRCGSADILEALDVPIELSPDGMADVLERAGLVFMFAPLLHPAMRHVAPVRRELRMPTIMNLLGPLTNPAGARRQVVGVSDPALLELIAAALRELGHVHALVVHGEPGIDELSPIGATRMLDVRDGAITSTTIDFREMLPGRDLDPAGLAGGDPVDNARMVLRVLRGEAPDVARAAVSVNAAAAIYVAGLADSVQSAFDVAEQSIDSGRALEALDRLRDAAKAAAPAH
ncbi:MAG TPA: anthranilate phosphoribosyltransferase [Longimicrobiales bacterium]|nr:anthranilate phosphoribosyltransferase [Longimicrobiales bacterium]